jgi:hypothetical protein
LKICEDTDGDGRADKFTVFCDQLSIPTSFVFANGGVIVIHSGKTEFFKDTNGDDKADERKVLFSGWGMGDTHATASNLRYGFDGWIWGVVGYSGFRGMVGGREVSFRGQGIYRFKPDGSALEIIRSSNNNTWGLGISEDKPHLRLHGQRQCEHVHADSQSLLRGRERLVLRAPGNDCGQPALLSAHGKVRQVDFHGRYTAGRAAAFNNGAGLSQGVLESARSSSPSPPATCSASSSSKPVAPISSPTTRATLRPATTNGPRPSTARSVRTARFGSWIGTITSSSTTRRRAVFAGQRCGLRKPAAGQDARAQFTGSPNKDAKPAPALRLDKGTPPQLVAALKNDNLFWRMTAQTIARHAREQGRGAGAVRAGARCDQWTGTA